MERLLLIVSALVLFNFSSSIALAAPAPVPQTGQTICYNSSGAIIPCAGTGQDGDIQAGVAWPDPRFTDHGNGKVTDNLTGLMWGNAPGPSSCPSVMHWNTALNYVACLNTNNYLGYSDWRLPSIRELASNNQGMCWSSTGIGNASLFYEGWYSNATNESVWISDYKTTISCAPAVRSDSIDTAPAPVPKTGKTISYAVGDDGSLQPGIVWPNPRFTDNSNGTITDNLTGLTWLKDANCFNIQDWDNALRNANTLASGACGLTDASDAGDWHLPNKNELWSLVDFSATNPALPSSHPFSNVQTINSDGSGMTAYWSSSTCSYDKKIALRILMNSGYVRNTNKSDNYYVWPVRSGQFWYFGPLKLSTKTTDLGRVAVNSISTPHEIKIRNKGATDLVVTSISMTGLDALQFSVAPGGSNACDSLTPTLAPSTSCTVLMSVTPASIGSKTASLTVITDSTTANIPLTATAYSTVFGVASDLSTGQPLSGATITLSTGSTKITSTNGKFNFGQLPNGTYSASISKTGYNGYNVNNLTISTTASAIVNFYLAPTGSLNFASITPLTGAEIEIPYNNRLKIIGGSAPYSFAVVPNFGDLPPGLTLDSASGLISGTPTVSGSYSFWAGCVDGLGVVTEKEFTINVAEALNITTPSLLTNTSATRPYSLTLGATGGTAAYSFAKTSGTLPPGLALSTVGVLSGTPTTVGIYSFVVTVTDAFGRTSTKSFSITIETPLVISTTRLNDAIVGAPYNLQLTTTGNIGPTSWTLASGSLPAGLQINGASGIISGTPSSIETQSITISVQDAGGRTSSKQYTIKTGNPLQITTTTMPTGYLTLAYSSPVQSSGGIAPITYSLTSGTLPAGLVLNTSTGIISGTPISGGVLANITVTASDSSYPTPQTVQQALSIRVLSTLPQYTVTLSLLDGSSPASVTGSMNCTIGTTCQPAQFNLGTTVTLTAVSDPTTLFTGWSGACTGTAATCSFYIDAAKSVTATFVVRPKYNLTLSFAGDGNGQVNGDITCTSGGTCAPKQFLLGSSAQLLPTPDVNSLFDGWSGACVGLGNCSLYMDSAKSVTATFTTGKPVKVMESNKTYNLLQDAYNDVATVSGNTIMARSVSFKENLILNRPIDVTIRGGYDATYQANSDDTAVQGSVIIRNGKLSVDKLIIW